MSNSGTKKGFKTSFPERGEERGVGQKRGLRQSELLRVIVFHKTLINYEMLKCKVMSTLFILNIYDHWNY